MDKQYMCYCGLYCGNCAVKAKADPAAQVLYAEMKKAGFEEFISMIPDGTEFWRYLKGMADEGTCRSCREGSGYPDCPIRLCAKEKGIELCALCQEYPCEHFDEMQKAQPSIIADNALLREHGLDAWGKLQDERRARGFTYTDAK